MANIQNCENPARAFPKGICYDTNKNNYNELIQQLKDFYKKHKKHPKYNEYTTENGLDPYFKFQKVAELNNSSLQGMLQSIDPLKVLNRDDKLYDLYVEEFKRLYIENGTIGVYSFFEQTKGRIPFIDWFLRHCPDESVKTTFDFLNWIGLYNDRMPKDRVIELILSYQSQLGRPIMYDDFRGREYGKPTLSMVKKHWGTVNKMKEALGLEILKPDMLGKSMSIKQIEKKMLKICDTINKREGRSMFTASDFNDRDDIVSYQTISKVIKSHYNISVAEYLHKHGYSFVNPGRGLRHKYNDGEEATSKYEYIFSNYLRNSGLKFDKDYFRNISYEDIVDGYHGGRNCDYLIKYKDRHIYIEIAGVLCEYKRWYYSDKKIEASDSKDEYRIKLKEKENLLASSGHEYFILFPCDLTKDFLFKILNGNYLEVKKDIEAFNKHNIRWGDVLRVGEIKYDKKKKTRDGSYAIQY